MGWNYSRGDVVMTIIQKTQYMINELGVKQQFICDRIGLSKSSFSEFVNGKRGIKDGNRVKLEALIDRYNIVEV
jgi:predicted transcriptional regulator